MATAPGPRTADRRPSEPAKLDFPLYQGKRLLGWLCTDGITVPHRIDVVSAVADMVALALAEPRPAVVERLLVEAEADREAVADELHDGTAQALVAARYATDLAVRSLRAGAGDVSALARGGRQLEQARGAVQQALVGVRQTIWWQRSRGNSDLLTALLALADRQSASAAAELRIAVVPPGRDITRDLRPAVVATAYRLIQELLRSAGGPVTLVLRRPGELLELDLRGGRQDAPACGRWLQRVRVLGGGVTLDGGRLRVTLPAGLEIPP